MNQSHPLREADLIFPSAHSSIHKTLGELKRSNLGIKNRLRSIKQDADFVQQTTALGLPIIANERCGSWYIKPAEKHGSAYFKSTDGHFGQWSFSLRRLNLHLLDLIGTSRGCIIIDSTRRGKSMPDALSKTVPIWIAVLNRWLFPDMPSSHALRTPPDVVSGSEHAQVEARLDHFVQQVSLLGFDAKALRAQLHRPMKAYWHTPAAEIADLVLDPGCNSVILCTASSRTSKMHNDEAGYVQGAADDQESWACGLNPSIFWLNEKVLLNSDEGDLPSLIQRLMLDTESVPSRGQSAIKPTSQVFITDRTAILDQTVDGDLVIECSVESDIQLEQSLQKKRVKYIRLSCGEGKVGSRLLRHELVKLDDLGPQLIGPHVICSCSTGTDLSVGVALAIICRYFSDDGIGSGAARTPNKDDIKRRLAWITMSMPDAAPSRATLQSVNAYLMR